MIICLYIQFIKNISFETSQLENLWSLEVVCWLVRRAATVQIQDSHFISSKTKYENIFLDNFLSADFWQKL